MPPRGAGRTDFLAEPATIPLTESRQAIIPGRTTMHFDAHQPVIDDLEARILTIRDSL
jgi:hypothetical protein